MNHDDEWRPELKAGELEFSAKYSLEHARNYYRKHEHESWSRKISNWREKQMARKALKMAGEPRSILDLPCGTGRFWDLLAEDPRRTLWAADYSPAMLKVAQENRPQAIVARFRLLNCSAFDIDLPAQSVDAIFCMRLLHHIGQIEDRQRLLREFHRVARQSVVISLWVDGNYKAKRRKRLERERARDPARQASFQNRFVQPRAQVENEFKQAGFEITGKVDFLPGYSMWRTYVLMRK